MAAPPANEPCFEVLPVRPAFGPVVRFLPSRQRRTVGPWCFLDTMPPFTVPADGVRIGPHPHCGLQTCTVNLAGAGAHHDSLGNVVTHRGGEAMIMTAGAGITHAELVSPEVATARMVQLWIALPDAHRHGPAAFDHVTAPPQVAVAGAGATVFAGAYGGVASPAPAFSPLCGVDLSVDGTHRVPLEGAHEHAVLALEGTVRVAGRHLDPSGLVYLGRQRRHLDVEGRGRVLLIGGEPLGEDVLIWWNFVARSWDEMREARDAWARGDARFGEVPSWDGPRMTAPQLP